MARCGKLERMLAKGPQWITLAQAGEMLGVSAQRVGQLAKRAGDGPEDERRRPLRSRRGRRQGMRQEFVEVFLEDVVERMRAQRVVVPSR